MPTLAEAHVLAAKAATDLQAEIRDAKDGYRDVLRQVMTHATGLSALRGEMRDDIKRLDARLTEGFERIEAQLGSIAAALASRKGP